MNRIQRSLLNRFTPQELEISVEIKDPEEFVKPFYPMKNSNKRANGELCDNDEKERSLFGG